MKNRQKYILVEWPEIRNYMTSENWHKCIKCKPLKGHECPNEAWMIPEEIYTKNTN